MNISYFALPLLEGLGVVLSPCILPILPIVLAAGVGGNKSRPYGIIVGFVLTFVAFTLLSRQIVYLLKISPNTIQDISFLLLLLFGVVMMSEKLGGYFNSLTGRFSDLGQNLSPAEQSQEGKGWPSGLWVGLCVALIWTPCAGPILAAVLVKVIQQKATYEAGLTLLSFSVGTALPMLVFILLGQKLIHTHRFFAPHLTSIRRILGLIIIATAIFGKFHIWPNVWAESDKTGNNTSINGAIKEGIPTYPAPIFVGLSRWFNTQEPLSLATLKGRVILIDFWTYSCINCLRTLPHIKEWHKKYTDKGLVIIGIHSPEFEFEKDPQNVERALKDHGIEYPVALDNELMTWNQFQNQYWPAHYLIDKQGKVVYTHFGEGHYDVTEANIRILLGMQEETDTSNMPEKKPNNFISPETYLGQSRADHFQSPEELALGQGHFTYPKKNLNVHAWALEGDWHISQQCVRSSNKGSKLKYHFQAADVHVVMTPGRPKNAAITATVLLDGKPINQWAGQDVKDGKVSITKDRLYHIIKADHVMEGELEIMADGPGLELYAFTFG